MPVWTGKYRTPKTLSSSSFMQTSSKRKKRTVPLPHLERPEHNLPSSEELRSRAVHAGAQQSYVQLQGHRDTGNAQRGAAPGTDVTVTWFSEHRQRGTATGQTGFHKTSLLQVQWSVKSPSRRRDALSWGESCKNNTHHKSYTICSTGEWDTPDWKPEDLTPCFKSCFPTETMIFEGRRYLLEKCSFWMRLIFLWGWFWYNSFFF